MTDFTLAAACNSQEILDTNLARSPLLATTPLLTEFGAPSASTAYNRMLDACETPLLVFAHQDVFLPHGWDAILRHRIAEVTAKDPDWALIGAFGIGLDGAHIGPVWSSSLGMIVGRVPMEPVPVQSYDEMLIVLRSTSGIRFDEGLPGWHMYGTDIVQIARAAGKAAYAVGLPCVHNDRFHGALGADFDACYRHMQRKWRAALPLRTPITKISPHGLHLIRDRWRNRRSVGFRAGMAVETGADPRELAARCGWAQLES